MGCWGLVIYAMTAATCSGNKALHCLTARDTRRAELCHNLGYKPHPCLLFPRQPFFRNTSTTLTWASRSSTSWERLDSPSVLATTQRETIAARRVRGCPGCNSWPCFSLLCRNCCHGHLSQCVCRHGDDQQHGCHLHEHLLLSLRSAGTVPRNETGANTRRWNILDAGYKLASNMVFLHLPSLIVASGCLLQYIHHSPGNSRRGFGIDCAILSCQVCVRNVSVGPSRFRLTGAVKNNLWWSLCFFAGVHQSDLGGFGSGRRRWSCWKCPCDSNGGLWGLSSGILLRLLPGHLPDPKQPVRKDGCGHQRAIRAF